MAGEVNDEESGWWKCLADMIKPFLPIRPECNKLLHFLKCFVESAQADIILSQASGAQRCIDVDTKSKPAILSIENWELFVLSIGLEVERPNFAVDFDMIGILTTPRVQESDLEHVLSCILALIDMDFQLLSRLVGLEKEELRQLWCLLMNFSGEDEMRQASSPCEIERFRNLWGKYQDILEIVGFKKVARGPESFISYHKTEMGLHNYRSLRTFLHGVLQNPVSESYV
ncbi:uncharacterized protein LOC135471683 [Liolophura sinensis]|uniref:uncharacterized protein LOC135471683 n=1 Tax=Liolophura sinensis TaxID=3198878 RepID=UPI00315809BA